MSRIPASPQELESLLEARARLRADTDGRWRGREEPKMSPQHAHDADMLDVVQKFERVYAQLGAEQRERPHAPELAARAFAAFNADSLSAAREAPVARNDHAEVSSASDVSIVANRAEPVEKYELPELDAIPPITAGTPAPTDWAGTERPRRRFWPMAFAGAVVAFVIGVMVGYLMVPGIDATRPRAKIDASSHGGTQLRLDYELPNR